jgi:hypothetical protein
MINEISLNIMRIASNQSLTTVFLLTCGEGGRSATRKRKIARFAARYASVTA